MEIITDILTSFEVKIFVHVVLYAVVILLGIDFLRWRRKEHHEVRDLDIFARRMHLVKVIAGSVFYLGLLIVILIAILRIVTPTAKVRRVTPAIGSAVLAYDSPIRVEFDVPVDTTKLRVNVNPKMDITVKSRPYIPFIPVARVVEIHPILSYPPGENIFVYLSDIKNPLSRDFGSEHPLEYQTPELPEISSVTPADGAKDIPSDTLITAHLSYADSPQNIWEIEIVPEHPYSLERSDTSEFTVRPMGSLKQNTLYSMKFYRTPAYVDIGTGTVIPFGEKHLEHETSFTTAKEPFISDFLPVGDRVYPDTLVEITFDEPMDTDSVEKAVAMQPEANTTEYRWTDGNTRLSISHSDFMKDTEYKVVIAKGAASTKGGRLEKDIEFIFHTVGKVMVEGPQPVGTQRAAATSVIRIPFNQEVDKGSAEQKFSLTPKLNGSFSWEDTVMIFKPDTPFAVGTAYTYRIAKDVQSVHGLSSDKEFEYSFSVGQEEFALSVPFYRQQELFTCNVAAARQLLAYRGIIISELQLKNEIGSEGYRGNGNPYKTHVDGYGTYWDPILRGVTKYRPARVYKDWSLRQILEEVRKGNPVMIWGQNGWSDPHEISWTNSDGTFIYAINGMHSAVVRGWRGPIENPTQVLINDPWRGVYALATGEFMRRYNFFKVVMVVD